jgi:hypothetical protein
MFGPWTTVNSRHGTNEDIDPRRKSAFSAPQYLPPPPVVENYAEGDSTPLVDTTPITHTGTPRNPGMDLPEFGAVHTGGHGAEIPQTKTYGRLRKHGDRIVLFEQQDHGHPTMARDPGNRKDLIRGLNAFPANNPPQEMYQGEGWRRAWWYTRRDEHDLSLPTRHHRWRIVPRWVAAAPVDRAAHEDGVQTGLMFSGLSKTIKNNFDRPRMRRQPGYVGENVMTDGTEDPGQVPVGDFL